MGSAKDYSDMFYEEGQDARLDSLDGLDSFSVSLPEPELFPVDSMPRLTRSLIKEAAAAIGCPADLVGLPMLVTLGAAIGNARRQEVKPGWQESALLFGAVVAPPGAKKTPANKEATAPAFKLQSALQRDYRARQDEYSRELREYDVDKRRAAKDGEPAPPPPKEPVVERTVVSDTTVEALVDTLQDNPRGVLSERDELAGWVRGMDQYRSGGKGSDRQFWLSTWSMRSATVDRRSRGGPVIIDQPFVSVFGGMQPDVLGELSAARDDGLMDRFLFSYPNPVPSRWSDEEITDAARKNYAGLYGKLRELYMPLDDYGDPAPTIVALSRDAKDLLASEINAHNEEILQPGFPSYLEGPWAKLEAYVCRIALILATCRAASDNAPERVEFEDVFNAWALVRYFKNHARRVYAAIHGQNPDDVLTADLYNLLVKYNGAYRGEPADFYAELSSRAKPRTVESLSKAFKRLAKRSACPFTVEGVSIWNPETKQGRRGLEIILKNRRDRREE